MGGADVSVARRSAGEAAGGAGVVEVEDAGFAEARVDLQRGMLSWDLEMPECLCGYLLERVGGAIFGAV